MKYRSPIGGRILSAIIIAAAIASLCVPALAVETGTGTNQMANVYATNSINLRGQIITNWSDVGGGGANLANLSNDVSALQGATNALNTTDTALKGATNALNTRVGTAETDIGTLQTDVGTAQTDITALQGATNALNATDTALKASTNALNTRAGSVETSTNALNTRVGTSETDITGLKGATNALNTRVGTAESDIGTLQTDVTALNGATNALNSGKFDKTGGTISGYVTYTPGAQQIADNVTTISVAQAVAKIGNDGTAVTFSGCTKQIANGTAGQFLTVLCTNNAPIRLNNGQGVKLVEGVSFSLNANDVIQLVYDGANWVEVHRADN